MPAALIATMYWVARSMGLGEEAKSPQVATISIGSSLLVAGGRARVSFESIERGPELIVSCASETRRLDLDTDFSDDICKIKLRQLELIDNDGMPTRIKVEIAWKD